MVEMNRRRFLIASAGVGALGLAGAAAVSWPELMQAAKERPLADGTGILVLVTLYGGNDGINTVIPYADPAYQAARPELAYAAHDVLALDDQLGLNPGLSGLARIVEATAAGDRARRGLPESGSQPLPVNGHLADGLTAGTGVDRLDWALARRQRRRSAACGEHRCGAAAAGHRCKGHGRCATGDRRCFDSRVG